jgi:Outer membrane lipoprotein carrier protein LolA
MNTSNGRRAFLLAVAWVAAQATFVSQASADETAKLLEEIAAARGGVRTMRGSFEQVRRIGLLATDVTSRGKVTLVRPGRLRWELLPPDAMTYWVGPEGLAYASGTAQASADRATAGPMGRVLDDLLVFLGGDLGSLGARYELTAKREGQELRIGARPRDESLRKIVQSFELVLASDGVTPVRVVVQETEKDFVRIRFSDVKHNVEVDAASMRPPSR